MTIRAKTILITIIFLIVGVLVAGGVYHRKAIGEWFKDNFPTKQTVNELKKENEEKDKQLADKDKEISSLNSQLETMQTNLTSLNASLDETTAKLNQKESELNAATTQRATLLSSITEIDNKINSTTDQTEIENLQLKKTAILNQIDSLNTEIATLTQDKETLTSEKAELQNQITTLETEKAELESEVEKLKSTTAGNVTITENELEIIPYSNLLDTYIYNDRFSFYYNSSNFNQAMSGSDTVDAVICNDKYNVEFDDSLSAYSEMFYFYGTFKSSEYNFVRDWSITYNLYDYYGNELDLSSCPEGFYLSFERITKEINSETSTINVTAYLNENRTIFQNNLSSTDLATLTGKYSDGIHIVDFDTLTYTSGSTSFSMEIYENYFDAIWSSGSHTGKKYDTFFYSYVESNNLLMIAVGGSIFHLEKVV